MRSEAHSPLSGDCGGPKKLSVGTMMAIFLAMATVLIKCYALPVIVGGAKLVDGVRLVAPSRQIILVACVVADTTLVKQFVIMLKIAQALSIDSAC